MSKFSIFTVLLVLGMTGVASFIIITYFETNVLAILKKISKKVIKKIGNIIGKNETNYHRDLKIGKINAKTKKVKLYRFLNELTIDLGLKKQGITPYELLFFILLSSLIIAILIGTLVFNSALIVFLMYPIVFIGVACTLYTKANITHDNRIEAVIEAENIICNNIKDGVVVAVRNSIDVMPIEVRDEFRIFLDNMENKNYHIKTALLDLNNNLGSISDDFIKKCIVFEMEEEHGIVGMFSDLVELNNIKTELRTSMKRKVEEIKTEFIIGTMMIFIFLGCVIAIYDVVRDFYFNNIIGQLLLVIDALIVVLEFVYITYLRAKEI